MIATGLRSTAERTRRAEFHSPQLYGFKSEWMDTGQDSTLSPTVFLVEQPAGVVLPAHFHRNNQFQLFIEGRGTIGPKALAPATIHYAGAYTAYGPLAAGPEGLKYFTIRPVYEKGLILVSDAKEQGWRKGPRRHATSKQIEIWSDAALERLGMTHALEVIPLADDGLRATVYLLPKSASSAGFDIGTGEAVFLVILGGSIRHGDAVLGRWESLYLSSDESPAAVAAGEGGAQVAVMVLPRRDAAYR